MRLRSFAWTLGLVLLAGVPAARADNLFRLPGVPLLDEGEAEGTEECPGRNGLIGAALRLLLDGESVPQGGAVGGAADLP
jgi:hypothetical protein